jgi:hypothetical protein
MVLCSLSDPLSTVRPSILSTALCFFNSPLSSLPPSVSSTALIFSKPSVLSTALCLLYSPLSPCIPSTASAHSTAFCVLYRPLSSLWTSAPSTALCPLNSPLSPLQPSVPSSAFCPSTALCPLYFVPPLSSPLLSHCFSFPLSPPLVSSPLCVFMPYVSHIWFLSLYLSPLSLPLLSLFSTFLLLFPLSLPLSFPFESPSVSLLYFSPLFLLLSLSSCISSLLSHYQHLSSYIPYVSHI